MSVATAALLGLPGCGKTSVGQILAELSRLDFTDTDQIIGQAVELPVSELLIALDEDEFRRHETQALAHALQEPGIVAVGAGAIMSKENQKLLLGARAAGTIMLYLAVEVPVALKRSGFDQPRPVALGPVRAWFRRSAQERIPYYEQVADITIDTSVLTAPEVAESAFRAITGYPRRA